MAHGRMQDDQKSLTVLTGTPVSGMVLLDRPSPAGYFIFPDLSVRHEGKYRLSFSVYEELKNANDEDDDYSKQNGPASPHVTHRLEVKSEPFTVYSAKKFPGLSESTSLSRIVAEQGCRVRIRRDVRMRRRDQKSGKEWDGYEEETSEARGRMSATPEVTGYPGLPPPHHFMDPMSRPRSSSNTSHHSLAPSMSLQRRPSLQDVAGAYHPSGYGTAPHTPQSAYPQPSQYAPSPTHNYGPTTFVQQQQMQPPPPQYQQQTYQQPAPSHPNYYAYGSSTQSQVAPGAQGYETQERPQRSSADHSMQMSGDNRRQSIPYGPAPPLPSPSHSANGPRFSYSSDVSSQSYQPSSQPSYSSHHGHQQSYGSSDMYSRAGPPEPIQPQARPNHAAPSIHSRPFHTLPPLTTLPMISSKQLEPAPPSPAAPQNPYHSHMPTPNESHKRGHAQVFGDRQSHQPLRQGARPDDVDIPSPYYGNADPEVDNNDPNALSMKYKRSNGLTVERLMQPHPHYQY